MKNYRISASLTREVTENGLSWESTRQLPSFVLEGDVLGIVSESHAESIAKGLVDPFGDSVVTVFAYEIPEDDVFIDLTAVRENLVR